jgi:hypothetical protein
MSLRFAIIKHIRTVVGQEWEDVVFEYHEDKLVGRIKQYLYDYLPFRNPKFGKAKYTEEEIFSAFDKAWKETVEEFKQVTIRIM